MDRRAALLVTDVQRVYMEPDPMVTTDGEDPLVMCGICQDYDVVVKDAHGAQDFGSSTAHELIDVFNDTWERAGARLIGANDVRF